ncbi:MAG: leucyl aminopeptidase [Anaerolineae bacterium]|nr:leucyl aminopeptidase [Anaerolineae bacterium]
MKVTVKQGGIQFEEAPLVVVNLFEGVTEPGGATGAVDRALGGAIREIITAGDFKGKGGETALLYTRGNFPAKRVLVVGLGKAEKFDLEAVRKASATAARKAHDLGLARLATIVHGGGIGSMAVVDAAQAVVEGTILGLYRYRELKSDDENGGKPLEELTLVEFDEKKLADVREGVRVGQIVAEAACLARDLSNRPGNLATPTHLAETAQRLAQELGLRCQVLERAEFEALDMGALAGVARGTEEPPKFIILEYNADKPDLPAIVLAGKGITFDSGGISLKPSEKMDEMKHDMSGAAAVLGTMQAVARLALPLHVVALIPATENLPSGRAIKPGDVLKALSGKTIEIISTDAEGRLVLADALAYAKRFNPAAVIDVATLTGACVVALGHVATGLMGTSEKLNNRIKTAAQATGERVWELPLWDEYDELIKSEVADVKNSGGRYGGAITGAMFLKKFASDYPWAHLDIAGTADTDKAGSYTAKGATGVGVRLLTQLLRTWPQETASRG